MCMSKIVFCSSCGAKCQPINGSSPKFCFNCGSSLGSLSSNSPSRKPIVDDDSDHDSDHEDRGFEQEDYRPSTASDLSLEGVSIDVPRAVVLTMKDILSNAPTSATTKQTNHSVNTNRAERLKAAASQFKKEASAVSRSELQTRDTDDDA